MGSEIVPDFVVSHYRVTGALGAGGMGEVYAGTDETLRRRVALKAIRPDHRLKPDAKARFLREARILSQLDHPHICRVYDYIETPERDWLVLELIEGETLSLAIRRGLGAQEQLRIAEQIAAVLVATHASGVVHRDLKPGNVMLTRSGDVKVLDFGLSATVSSARHIPSAGALVRHDEILATAETYIAEPVAAAAADVSVLQTRGGRVMGTLGYMSPEQARGETATTASDMYSFGLVLQELFTGRLPYDETSDPSAILANAQRGETREPEGVSSAVAALLRRLKSAVPATRPTAVDTAERLRWIRETPRRRLRNLIAAGVVLTLVLGAIKYTIDLSRERTTAVLAREEADRRRDQAEDLIGFMLGDLRGRLTAVGRLEILDNVGKKALDYFAAVPVEALTGEELYRRSQAMHQIGQVRQAQGDLDGARKAYEESLAQAENLVQRDPQNATWQLSLGSSHFYVGDLKRRFGDSDGALTHFRAYQQIAEQLVDRDSTNAEWKLELSYGHSNVAAILSQKGDYLAAKEELKITGTLQEELLQARPDDASLLASRANNHNRLGVVLERLGELSDAVEQFKRELQIYARLAAKDPRNARAMRRVGISRLYLGLTLWALGETTPALAELRQALADAEALVALDPSNADWQRDLAIVELWLGRLLLDQGQSKAAMTLFQKALDILKPLASRAGAAASAQQDLARTHESLAGAYFAMRQYRQALQHSDTAVAILLPLQGEKGPLQPAALALGTAENVRALARKATGDVAGARQSWTRSVEVLEPLAKGSSDRSPLDPLVRALVSLGRVEEAKPWFEKLMALGYRNPAFLEFWKVAGSGLSF